MDKKDVILEFKDVTIEFGQNSGSKKKFTAVDKVSFKIYRGETFGLVGESGSGKTTIGRSIVRINETESGEILFNGEKINGKISRSLQKQLPKKIQMIFQDPMASLNERATINYIVAEGVSNYSKMPEKQRQQVVEKALSDVGLLPEFANRFPHEFSGGQRQRIGIARSLIMKPELIIADEPISALDVSIRAQVLNLLKEFKTKLNLTYLFIAHDLSIIKYFCDRTAVIHKGVIVELAETEELFKNPLHPYTKTLLSAIPLPDPRIERNKKIEFYDENINDYSVNKPKWVDIGNEHFVLGNESEIEKYMNK